MHRDTSERNESLVESGTGVSEKGTWRGKGELYRIFYN